MLDLIFYDINSKPQILSVTESCYKNLAEIGFSKKVNYKNIKLTIEDEKYNIYATELNKKNRSTLLNLIELERQQELEKIFEKINSDNPTIKEIREYLKYIKELTSIYKLLAVNNNKYFSYE